MEIKERGRIRYVEPTNLGNVGEESLSDSINFPYEDFNMGVDLSIRCPNRYSCGLGEQNGEFTEYYYTSNNGTISFLGGTKIGKDIDENGNDAYTNYLTTNYTDISMTDPSSNTSEALGINSITIEYNSWMYPQVTIKFVDLRGATVMLPSENGYYNEEDMGNSSPIYKALFTFPYPIFKLKVKGFYGKGVTYELAVQKTSLAFDSNSGNFEITASFIGYMYGIYSDIPMSFISIAPYTKRGAAYWDSQIQNGVFKFLGANGMSQCDMVKIPELRLKLAQVANSLEYVSVAAEGQKVQDNLDEKMKLVQTLMDAQPLEEWVDMGCEHLFYLEKGERETETVKKELSERINEYIGIVSAYDSTYGTEYVSKIKELKKFTDVEYIFSIDYVLDEEKGAFRPFTNFDTNKHNKYVDKNYTTIMGWFKQECSGLKNFTLYILHDVHRKEYYKTIFSEDLVAECQSIQQRKIDEETEYKRKQDVVVEEALGFRPSIKNIYDLIFAHMETFMECFYDTMSVIRDQLDNKEKARKKETYGIVDGDTDTERVVNGNGDETGIARAKYLPPFTAFYKNNITNGEIRKQLRWPGELVDGNNLVEVPFVEELLNGVQLYSQNAMDVQKMIEQLNFTGNTVGKSNTISNISEKSPSATVYKFIPITTYDLINKDSMPNPYAHISEMLKNNDSCTVGNIMATFAIRAFYYLWTIPYNSTAKAKAFGSMEAVNFFKGVGDEKTNSFINFIKTYADNNSNSDDVDYFLKNITSQEKNEITSAWDFGGDATNKNLFKISGDYLSYALDKSEDKTCYPMRNCSLENYKKELGEGISFDNNDYIFAVNSHNVEENSFAIFEERDYLSSVYNCVKAELAYGEGENNGSESKTYNKRCADEYGTLIDGENTVDTFSANIKQDYNGKLYYDEDEVFTDLEGKEIDGLYEIITNGNVMDKDEIFIKYPTMVDEKYEHSLFDEPIYKIQDNIKAKAYLFLSSLPIKGNGSNGGIDEANINGVTLKARLLKEGSYYWRALNNSLVKTSGIYLEDDKEISYSCKAPNINETFCDEGSFVSMTETIKPIKENSRGKYIKWKMPNYTTQGRVNRLIKYFEDWAESNEEYGFASNEGYLTNTKFYAENNFSKGLKIINSISDTEENVDGRKVQVFLKHLFCTICTTLDYYNNNTNISNRYIDNYIQNGKIVITNSNYQTVRQDLMKSAFRGFIEQLHKIYGDTAQESEISIASAEALNPFNNTDIKLSTYNTIKSLYDRWLCSPLNGRDTWKFNPLSRVNGNVTIVNSKSDFDNFAYTDNYYHRIGLKLTINISKVSEWLSNCLPTSTLNTTESIMHYNQKSVYEFLSEVAQHSGGMLMALPQKFGCYNDSEIEKMFTPHSINNHWDENSSSFLFMYTYKTSEHLGDDISNLDMNGWSREGDGFNLTDEEIIGALRDNDGYTIPGFGVTYAKQNQSIFKNITLNTETPGITEAGIATTMHIASQENAIGPRESVLYGQDLYRVYSQYAYKCSVECMGNMQIMPLMYFQLNNIPMWKGAYMIQKVTHEISQGNIVTHFEGVRQNKYAIPIVDCFITTENNTGDEYYNNEGYNITTYGTSIDEGNGVFYSIKGNSNVVLNNDIDFDETNITKQKPLICLSPPHNPYGSKSLEWAWGTNLVDNYIIPKLKTFKFKDGTSYARNIQRCNKSIKKTPNMGSKYSMSVVDKYVSKFGSDSVISVVPHWNVGANKHVLVIYGLGGNSPINPKSIDFANVFKECYEETITKALNGGFPSLPKKAMKQVIKVGTLRGLTGRSEAEDGACMRKCANILTENWFADYKSSDTFDGNWETEDCRTKEDGKYLIMRGWLESEEGLNAVADVHAKAIKRYIDSL